jgi:protein-L-isoaspartate(D-aspartate) O-methyltransferase
MNDDTMTTSPETLRATMVDRIVAGGWTRSDRVANAMRDIPRHRFVAAAPIEEAYADQAVITKRDSDGAALSCASVPSMVALMLDQLDVQPGHRVLEIGAGTGYNAALLAHLTGSSGQVTTVDIDPEVSAQARQALDATCYGHVHVATRDGALGDAEHAPYDRIILTVGAWDVPPAWWAQLVPGGRLVLPLRWRGQTRTVAFTREDGRLRSDSVELCGFVPMVGQEGERTDHIDDHGDVALFWDADQPIDPSALRSVFDQPRTAAWSAVTVGAEEPFDGVWLRLTALESGTCRIAAERAAVDAGLCTPAVPVRSPALVERDSLAYFTLRRREEGDTRVFELGAIGHGPNGPDLANRMCEQIHAWGLDRTARPSITAYPVDSPDDTAIGDSAIPKPHTRLVVAF